MRGCCRPQQVTGPRLRCCGDGDIGTLRPDRNVSDSTGNVPRFLSGLLGMTDARVTTAKLVGSSGPTLIELLCFNNPGTSGPTPLNAIGPTHVALTVSDLDGLYDRIIEAGHSFNAPPRVSPDGGAKVAFCQDPDGTFLELVEPLTP